MHIYWRGSIQWEQIDWILDSKEVILDDALEEQRGAIWNNVMRDHPATYDGNLLALQDYDIASDSMTLYMKSIKFSRILTLERLGVHLKPYGTIGMQLIVHSPDRNQFLIGQRNRDSMYCPLFYSVPGGILEVEDTKGSFKDACLREFNEEVELEISDNLKLIGITSEIHGTVGCVFLLIGVSVSQPGVGEFVRGNDEWEDNSLQWHPINNLEGFTVSNCLEAPIFLKKNWVQL